MSKTGALFMDEQEAIAEALLAAGIDLETAWERAHPPECTPSFAAAGVRSNGDSGRGE